MGQHKNKKDRRRRLTPIQWALLAGALLLVAAVFTNLSGREAGGGTPAISVNQTMFDFGVVKFNTPLTVQVIVTNTGDGTLRFTDHPYVTVLEGC